MKKTTNKRKKVLYKAPDCNQTEEIQLAAKSKARSFYPRMPKQAGYLSVEDVESDLLCHILDNFHRYDSEQKLAPWLNTVCSNFMKNHLQKHYKIVKNEIECTKETKNLSFEYDTETKKMFVDICSDESVLDYLLYMEEQKAMQQLADLEAASLEKLCEFLEVKYSPLSQWDNVFEILKEMTQLDHDSLIPMVPLEIRSMYKRCSELLLKNNIQFNSSKRNIRNQKISAIISGLIDDGFTTLDGLFDELEKRGVYHNRQSVKSLFYKFRMDKKLKKKPTIVSLARKLAEEGNLSINSLVIVCEENHLPTNHGSLSTIVSQIRKSQNYKDNKDAITSTSS